MGLMKRLASGGGARSSGHSGSRLTFLEVEWFFDSTQVARATDKASRRVLSKLGSFVRQDARKSIKKPRKVRVSELSESRKAERKIAKEQGVKFNMPFAASKPGDPPRNQTEVLKRTIFFFYNSNAEFVDIGPAKLHGLRGENNMEALEFGGVIVTKKKNLPVKARPFMQPALDKNLPLLPSMWEGAIR